MELETEPTNNRDTEHSGHQMYMVMAAPLISEVVALIWTRRLEAVSVVATLRRPEVTGRRLLSSGQELST